MSYAYFVTCSVALVLIFVCCSRYKEVKEKLPFVFPDYIHCSVVKVIDGDKFDCQLPDIQIESVRMIGVQIPPSVESKASEFTGSQLKRGLPVRLEHDEVTSDGENLLAYVYLPDGQMINSLLIEQGYAEYRVEPPNLRYEKYFSELESEAKKNGKGLWGEDREINK